MPPRMYTKTVHQWPNHADTYELCKRVAGEFVRLVLSDDQQDVMDALQIEVNNEELGAENAVTADWDTLSHTEDWEPES